MPITDACAKFEQLLVKQLARVEQMKSDQGFIEYSKLDKIIIGVCGGDGIGPTISAESEKVLRKLLAPAVAAGKVEIRTIEGLTIENRIKVNKAIPDDVMAELKKCHVLLKGPTTTPRAGDPWPNIESANVAMRKELDLFANVRPVKVPDKGINWTFFRENTEGSYVLGSSGVNVSDDLAVDFTVTTTQGTQRIARLAFEYAKNNHLDHVAIVTKANVIKATDGKFLRLCQEMAKEYPDIRVTDWYIDIMTAKLVDEKRRTDFKVFILPNLYGDIITDEAAEFQGGVGTAGSANIGKQYAMFEAIHGSAPRMVDEGRAQYADPCSMLRATVMLLSHIGYQAEADRLEKALDFCMFTDKKINITGRDTGATCAEFSDYIIRNL
ncbi:MAG TPA: isocitrate/isopropylmalate family dehydrogenase [Oscillospiraceae bacterium]|nr:isocitrate/isopropylmalate family dehydrogenase [Oscillospiraceae bacterium]HPS34928.1 isocitrate/isopropylmalate family dehydrogenase [Oscillospiraceae bacterium]